MNYYSQQYSSPIKLYSARKEIPSLLWKQRVFNVLKFLSGQNKSLIDVEKSKEDSWSLQYMFVDGKWYQITTNLLPGQLSSAYHSDNNVNQKFIDWLIFRNYISPKDYVFEYELQYEYTWEVSEYYFDPNLVIREEDVSLSSLWLYRTWIWLQQILFSKKKI